MNLLSPFFFFFNTILKNNSFNFTRSEKSHSGHLHSVPSVVIKSVVPMILVVLIVSQQVIYGENLVITDKYFK